MRRFRDRDFIRTEEGLFFCVIGPVHPNDRIISYLKYVPEKSGSWGWGDERFRRVLRSYTIPSLLETLEILASSFPQYLFQSEFLNITMSAVPVDRIARHYKPEEKLRTLLKASNLDPLQERLVDFARILAEMSHVSLEDLGVTGSILIDIHRPEFSDLDVTVYGRKSGLAVMRAMMEAPSSRPVVNRLEGEALERWCREKVLSYPLSSDEALEIFNRRWNIGTFKGRFFSIHPVKLEDEVCEEYGDKTFHPDGLCTVTAVVVDDTESIFLPAIYNVRDARVLEGPRVEDVVEIVSYEGLYSGLARVGETIVAKGKLELVVERNTSRRYHRVLVGSSEGRGQEYIKIL